MEGKELSQFIACWGGRYGLAISLLVGLSLFLWSMRNEMKLQ